MTRWAIDQKPKVEMKIKLLTFFLLFFFQIQSFKMKTEITMESLSVVSVLPVHQYSKMIAIHSILNVGCTAQCHEYWIPNYYWLILQILSTDSLFYFVQLLLFIIIRFSSMELCHRNKTFIRDFFTYWWSDSLVGIVKIYAILLAPRTTTKDSCAFRFCRERFDNLRRITINFVCTYIPGFRSIRFHHFVQFLVLLINLMPHDSVVTICALCELYFCHHHLWMYLWITKYLFRK